MDEVSELPPPAQVKLLRVIQEGEIEKIGRTERINVNVRVISATNKNLAELVNQNKFREDLFYRLSVVPIQINKISERKDDIVDLVYHFLNRFSKDMGIRPPELTEDALAKLSEDGIIDFDDDKKASMVSNLMVVLCGDKEAIPVVNAGTLNS